MNKLIIFFKCYWYLAYYYIMLRNNGLQKVLNKIEHEGKLSRAKRNDIIYGFQTACRWHLFNVECLERSITLYSLLRSSTYSGRFCIGIRRQPFLSHAWVETNIEELDESKYRDKFQVFMVVPKESENACQ